MKNHVIPQAYSTSKKSSDQNHEICINTWHDFLFLRIERFTDSRNGDSASNTQEAQKTETTQLLSEYFTIAKKHRMSM